MTADAVGGVWSYAVDLAAGLRAHAVETILAVLGPAPDEDQRAMIPDGVEMVATGLPLDWLARGAASVLAAGDAVAALADARGVDIVQLNSPALAASGAFTKPVVAVAHGCVATWWRAARGGAIDAGLAWHADLTRQGLLAAERVVAPTRAFAADVAATYALPEQPAAVHNGRRGSSGIGTFVANHAFTAGRLWDPVKGTPLLDNVAGRIDAPFRAAGPVIAPHGETVTTRHLDLLGKLSGMAIGAELASRPIYVSAARFEPFGLAVLEAAQAGCPLVLSDIASFRELWDGAATFVDPDDEDGFAAAVSALLADPQRHDREGRAAAQRALRYTPERVAAEMAALYADVLGNRTARAA